MEDARAVLKAGMRRWRWEYERQMKERRVT